MNSPELAYQSYCNADVCDNRRDEPDAGGGAVSALSNHQPGRQPSPDIGVCSLPLSNGAIVCAHGYHQRVPYDRGDGTQAKDGG